MEMSRGAGDHEWFPFSATEVEIALGIVGFLATMISLLGLQTHEVALFSAGALSIVYVAGLLVHSRARTRTFDFIENGGLQGEGYLPFFRDAKRSLLLTHVDDDPPSEELLALYRTLLGRGVQMRRVVFQRGKGSSLQWLVGFGEHPNLMQRVVPPAQAELMAFSFVVVDEHTVVVSVPGFGALDADPYAQSFVLRHLLVLRDETVAGVFIEMHRQLWERAAELKGLQGLKALAEKSSAGSRKGK